MFEPRWHQTSSLSLIKEMITFWLWHCYSIAIHLAFINSVSEADFAAAAEKKVSMPRWEGKYLMGHEYVTQHSIPNVYFHITRYQGPSCTIVYFHITWYQGLWCTIVHLFIFILFDIRAHDVQFFIFILLDIRAHDVQLFILVSLDSRPKMQKRSSHICLRKKNDASRNPNYFRVRKKIFMNCHWCPAPGLE